MGKLLNIMLDPGLDSEDAFALLVAAPGTKEEITGSDDSQSSRRRDACLKTCCSAQGPAPRWRESKCALTLLPQLSPPPSRPLPWNTRCEHTFLHAGSRSGTARRSA